MDLTLITLKVTRYSDKQSILTAYSREHGRVSMAIPATSGKLAARMRALTMPLSIVGCVSDTRPGREILPMRQVSQLASLATIHSNPVKQMLAMFLAETLSVVLPTGQSDKTLFDFLTGSIQLLDEASAGASANFHICFLSLLSRHLGIEPDTETYSPGFTLDLLDGIWRATPPLHHNFLTPEESAVVWKMMRMTYSNMHRYRFNRQQRNLILDGILDYYSLHYVSMRRIKSLDVLRAIL